MPSLNGDFSLSEKGLSWIFKEVISKPMDFIKSSGAADWALLGVPNWSLRLTVSRSALLYDLTLGFEEALVVSESKIRETHVRLGKCSGDNIPWHVWLFHGTCVFQEIRRAQECISHWNYGGDVFALNRIQVFGHDSFPRIIVDGPAFCIRKCQFQSNPKIFWVYRLWGPTALKNLVIMYL